MKKLTILTTPSRFASHPFNALKGNLFPDLTVLRSYVLTVFFLSSFSLLLSPLQAQEKKMFTHLKNGERLATPISQIDSVTFGTGEGIELGVWINGLYWAKCNVDSPGFFTEKPEEFGMFYQWGSNVGWSSTDPLKATDGIHTWRDLSETGNVWKAAKDPCPTGWRVPTNVELESLVKSGSVWKKKNDIDGRFFANEKFFLPAANCRVHSGSLWQEPYTYGNYWTSTQSEDFSLSAYALEFSQIDFIDVHNKHDKVFGFSVRCVKE